MRRIVFQLDDRPEVTGEVGLDNEGNLYLRGNVGGSIRLLQDTSNVGDYVPEASNLINLSSIVMHSGGYVVMGKQCFVTLLLTKTPVDDNEQNEFDVTLPFPPAFSGQDAEATAVFVNNNLSEGYLNVAPNVDGTVHVRFLGNPFYPGEKLHQVGFCYRIP